MAERSVAVTPSCALTRRLDSISAGKKFTGISDERLQLEALCLTALELSGGDYAFVLCPGATGAYAEQFVRLGAVVNKSRMEVTLHAMTHWCISGRILWRSLLCASGAVFMARLLKSDYLIVCRVHTHR